MFRVYKQRGVSYMCNRCSGWFHSKCYGLQNAAEYRRLKNWEFSCCSSPPTPPTPLPSTITTKTSDGAPFTILQFNANGIGNKQVELGEFLERHQVKVAVIPESKLTSNSRTPNIQNFTTVRKDCHRGQGGDLLTLIHKSINFSRRLDSPDTLADPNLEELITPKQIANYFNRQFKAGQQHPSIQSRQAQHLPPKASWIQRNRIPHCTLQRLRHILSDSVDLEVIHCHPNPETRQGLLSQHF